MGLFAQKPSLLIRADACPAIGIGHVMRMLALAQAWLDRGGRVELLGEVGSLVLRERLDGEGVILRPLPLPNTRPGDLDALLLAARETGAGHGGWIALDGYGLGPDYQAAARGTGAKVLVVDDMAHQPRYEADLVLNQNLGPEGHIYNAPGSRLLLGPRHALLRREFRKASLAERVPQPARRILVSTGGADPAGFTATLLHALALTNRRDFEARIICGPSNPLREELARLAQNLPFPATLVSPGADMPEHMAWAELALCAAGSTCWELAHLGVPMLAFALADNQEGVLAGLVRAQAAISCGVAGSLSAADLADRVVALADDVPALGRLSARGRELVDGQGALRVAETMRPTCARLRPARPEDCDWLFALANDPVVRAASFNPEPIPPGTHVRWFQGRLADAACRLLVVEDQFGTPVGQVRLERKADHAEVSVSLAGDFRGLGLGSGVLRLAAERCREEFGLDALALIRPENIRSIRAFARAGFREAGETQSAGQPALRMVHGRQDA